MLRSLPKFLLVATAFAPVLLTSAIVSYLRADSHHAGWMQAWPQVALAILAVLICIWVMQRAERELARQPVIIKSIKPADKELIGFVLAYLLPLARGTHFEGVPMAVVLGTFFLVVMTSNAYHTNPLLGLLGWHFYEIVVEDVSYILVSRKNLHNIKSVTRVVSLTDYMLLDATKENK